MHVSRFDGTPLYTEGMMLLRTAEIFLDQTFQRNSDRLERSRRYFAALERATRYYHYGDVSALKNGDIETLSQLLHVSQGTELLAGLAWSDLETLAQEQKDILARAATDPTTIPEPIRERTITILGEIGRLYI